MGKRTARRDPEDSASLSKTDELIFIVTAVIRNHSLLSPTPLIGLLLAVTVLAGCPNTGNMKTVEVDVMTPAEIPLPSSIENLLVVDRTVYTGNPFDSNEALITPEVPGEDRDAAQTLIFFLQRYLGASPRYQTVIATESLTGNSFNKEFPRAIPWDTVRDLCRRYQTDALVAIEVYGSDFNVSTPRPASAGQLAMVNDPQQSRYAVEGAGNVVFGFRVYDPETETIVDEHVYRHKETWDATGPDPASALANLIDRKQAIGDLIHLAGMEYSRRIAPIPVPVTRKYYGASGAVPAMATGTQFAEDGKWQEAADTWEAGIPQAPKREAGQLAYNVAIAYEKLGETEKAQAWAQRAAEEYANDQAKAYLSGLEERRTLEIRADGQMR